MGSITIPKSLVERWERQIATPYEDLSNKEKDSDRTEVRAYLKLENANLEIQFVRGDKRPIVTEDQYKAAMDELKELVNYPGFNSKHIQNYAVYAVYAVALSPEKKAANYKRCQELDAIVDRYKKPIERVTGIVHEQLLTLSIIDLEYKNSLFPSDETKIAIAKIKESLMWLSARQVDREERGVQGNYKK